MADDDLGVKLSGLVEEIKDVMEQRKKRIEELRSEIVEMEQQNSRLEHTISDLLSGF